MILSAPASGSKLSGLGRLSRRIRGVLRLPLAMARSVAHRRDVARLLQMDDRALKDVGLVRSDVQGALAEPFPRDPSDVLRQRSLENRLRQRSREASARRLIRR